MTSGGLSLCEQALCLVRYFWFMPLCLYMNKTSYLQNKSGKNISPVQLGGMAYWDQMRTLTYEVTKPPAPKPTILPPSVRAMS